MRMTFTKIIHRVESVPLSRLSPGASLDCPGRRYQTRLNHNFPLPGILCTYRFKFFCCLLLSGQDPRFNDKFGKRACFPELKAFYYPKTNIIPSENTQVDNGDRLKIYGGMCPVLPMAFCIVDAPCANMDFVRPTAAL